MNRASKCSTQQYTVVPTAKAGSGILVMTTGFRIPLTNDILIHLTAHERAALLDGGERMVLPAGETFAAAGEVVSTAYFPDSGVLSYISTMATGHQLAVAAIGPDGLIGAGQLLGIVHHPYRIVALLDSEGYQIPSQALRRAFDVSENVRAAVLAHVGRQLIEVTSMVACSRVHSHRQRLARWLLLTMDKAQQSSLHVTHDVLAQMVGGPRHAVTVALSELRARGAIAHLRGRVDICDRELLVRQACECYVLPTSSR